MPQSQQQLEHRAPTQSLHEKTAELLNDRFAEASGPRHRILWWDADGHLEDILKEACKDIDADFVSRNHPLAFREWVANQGNTPESEPEKVVWYVQDASHDRDWFRDVGAMGGVIERGIEYIVAQMYDVPVWKVRPWGSEDEPVSKSTAAIFNDELRGQNRPHLNELQMHLLTGDDSKPARYVLRSGWPGQRSDPEIVDKIRNLLIGEGVLGLEDVTSPDAIVEAVRRWAVAGWLYSAGVSLEALPFNSASDLKYGLRCLKKVIREGGPTDILSKFQKTYWPEIVEALNAPWEEAGTCPVDGALEARLWTDWLEAFDAGRHEQCRTWAQRRAKAFQEATGRNDTEVDTHGAPWTQAWKQAAALADLAHRYETWDDRDVPAHELYADKEQGSWHIDDAVRHIIVSGTPESNLPDGHPATEALAAHRTELVRRRYIDYLKRLGEKMERDLTTGTLLDDTLRSSTNFWSDNKKTLAAGNEGILFYIDALRLDLARALKQHLEEQADHPAVDLSLTITESRRLSVLPSETKFGMAAVLPEQSSPFEVGLDDGELNASRGRVLSTTRRKQLLEDEGWSVTTEMKGDRAWQSNRVAYMLTELDDYGEKSLDDIEGLLAQRVEKLANQIFEKLRKGRWSRAHVITDHGFVLLPEDTGFDAKTPPEGDVARRRVAGAHVDDSQHGVRIHRKRQPDLSYLHTPVRILVHPQERFRKRGIEDKRYYHGGALPQECIISFLSIEVA